MSSSAGVLGSVLAAAMVLGACGGPPPAPPPNKVNKANKDVGVPTAAEAEPTCGSGDKARLHRELEGYCWWGDRRVEPAVPFAPFDAEPTTRPDFYVEVQLSSDGAAIDGLRVEPGRLETAVRDAIAADQARAHALGAGEHPWIISAAGDTPRADVHALFAALHSAGRPTIEVALAVATDRPVPTPRNAAYLGEVQSELEHLDPSQRASRLAEEIEKKMVPCAGVAKAFAAVATATPESRCKLLSRGIAEALHECRCPAGVDPLLTLIYAISIEGPNPSRVLHLAPATIDPEAPPTGKGASTWSEIAAELTPARLDRLWLGS